MDTKNDVELAFVNALKAVDYEKNWKEKYSDQLNSKEELKTLADWEKIYLEQLKELGRELFDMTDEDFENNEMIVEPNDTK